MEQWEVGLQGQSLSSVGRMGPGVAHVQQSDYP